MSQADPRCVIQTVGLSMIYRSGKLSVAAVPVINKVVHPGEFVAIMGPSGCGKSTLMHLVGGLLQPTSGHIFIEGVDLAALSDADRTQLRRRRIGMIFQRFNLLPTLSARGNIELAKKIHGNGTGTGRANGIEEIVDLLGIREKLPFRPAELSGGEQQRVAIARALVNQPAIVLADEPTGSLDSANSRLVLGMLQRLNETLKQTVIMITHDAEAASMANRVIEMRDGEILQRVHQFSYEPEFEGLF